MISSARAADVGRFQQRLFGGGVERRDLGDAVDQALVVEPADRIPVDRIALRVGEAPRFGLQPARCAERQRLGLVARRQQLGLDLAERRRHVELADDAEQRHALEHDVVAAIVERLDLGDLADAAEVEQRRRAVVAPPSARGWIMPIRRSRAIASPTSAR